MRICLRDVLRQTVLPEARAPGPARLRAEKGYSLSEREYPFCFYRPQHCLFSALPRSAKNAGWQLARRWRGSRSYAAYQQAASVTVRSTAYFPRCRAAQKMPDGSSLAADAATARMPCISRLRPLPSAALLIFRAAVQRKKCRMAARRWRGSRSYAAYQQAASVTVRSTAYFPRCCAAQKNAGWQLARR